MYWTGLKYYSLTRRNLRLPPERLKARQWRAMQELVDFAWRKVPLYRQLYESAGFTPDQLRTPEDLLRVPPTRKAVFQQADPDSVIARGYHREALIRRRTSGSTGSPLNVYYTPEDRIYRTLIHLRILFHNGMGWRDLMAHISDSRHATDERYSFQKLGFLPKEFVYAADSPEDQLQALEAVRPAVIYGYASSLALLAGEVEKRGGSPLRPRRIFTTGELLNPSDRVRIERAFGVQVRDIYGLVEGGDVAWQCPAGDGYHLNVDSFYIEVDAGGRPAGPGEAGRLVITNLHSRAMPFIRYEIGDVLTPPQDEPCPCGCTFPRLQVIQGRADDWLHSADGQKVSPLIFVVASIPGVMQYRMVQEAYDQLRVEILPGPGYSEETLNQVGIHVREVMGPGLTIETVRVEAIPKDPSGKMRRVISRIGVNA
ncbi:MAG: phenylacetate--CoA ligase family protein [Candidatus Zixiibacteriota bacterium]|nr:MAG: phenylacetate--CoA ligase family protein [candidate division Zixibacteria bacterium]